ncbi:MAG: hypothetical protein JSU03_06415 [Bacteroidetes bacterium]|nr:hypothetical protein [Bacteroidota bacterium]
MKKKILLKLFFVLITTTTALAQWNVGSPQPVGNSYDIKLYKKKCTDGSCKNGETGTLKFQSYGNLQEFTGTFGPENTFVNGLLTYNSGVTYKGSFRVVAPEDKGKYSYYTVFFDSGTYTKPGSIAYTAKFINNLPQGYSDVQYNDGTHYTGTLKDGFFDGTGKIIYNNGLIYDGGWQKGHRVGKGSFMSTKDPSYFFMGEFNNDYPNGQGKLVTKDSPDTFYGNFSNGHKEGFFKKVSPANMITWLKYKNDSIVNNNLVKIKGGYCLSGNCNNGKGKMYREDGVLYEGDMKNGIADGTGTFTYSDGSYTGPVHNNIRNGIGKFTWLDGHYYQGDFKEDAITGEGTLHISEKNYYTGHFENGKYNGHGKYYFADGAIYEGNFIDDIINGFGTYIWTEGDFKGAKYVGNFKNSKYDGKGTYYFPNGKIFDGNFKDGVINGSGTFTDINGDKYISENWIGLTFEVGKKVSQNNVEIEGEYVNNTFLTKEEQAAIAKQNEEKKKRSYEVVMHSTKNANLARDYWVELTKWECDPSRKYYITISPNTKYHATPFGGHYTMQVVAPDNSLVFEAEAGTYWAPRVAGTYIFQVKFYQDKIIGDYGPNDPHTNYVSGLNVKWALMSKWNDPE